MGYTRLLVADRNSRIIAELEPDIGPVSWRLNNVGRTQFSMSLKDNKAIGTNLLYGNRLLIEFDNGLPNWGGMIDPPRIWESGRVTATAYSGEYIFGTRTTDRGRYFSGSTVGYIYEQLVIEANEIDDMGIEMGEVWRGGVGHSPEYHFKDLLTIFRDSIANRLSDADFDVVASEDSGKVLFTANVYERKGIDKPGVVLVEGKNLTDIRLQEQGTIVNTWYMVGEGSNWGDDRITSSAEDETSQATYGMREDSKIYSDVSIQETLDAHAENALAESKDPHNMLELTAANEEPALFADYDIGDSVRVLLHSYGFGGYDHMVRIWDREYDPATGLCRLVVREDD